MSIASVVRCKFSYVPIPIPAVGGRVNASCKDRKGASSFDQDAIDSAENEGWPVIYGIREDRKNPCVNKDEPTSESSLSKIKKAVDKCRCSLFGAKKKGPEPETYHVPEKGGKDKGAGFVRPPYID